MVFSILELLAFGAFGIAFVIGAALDRRGTAEPFKWTVAAVLILASAIWWWSSWTFAGIWATIRTVEFWTPVGYFLGVGLAYSVIEFILTVRSFRDTLKEAWQDFRNGSITIRDRDIPAAPPTFLTIAEALAQLSNEVIYRTVRDEMRQWVSTTRYSTGFLNLRVIEGTKDSISLSIEPSINRGKLADFIGAWTIFWPAYVLERIIGDLLVRLWEHLADLFTHLGARFVKFTFRDVFKI